MKNLLKSIMKKDSYEDKFIQKTLPFLNNTTEEKAKLEAVLRYIPMNSVMMIDDAFEIINDSLVPVDELENVAIIIKEEANKGTIKEIIKIQVYTYLSTQAIRKYVFKNDSIVSENIKIDRTKNYQFQGFLNRFLSVQ